MPPQRRGQRRRRAGSIAKPPAGRRQPQPRFPHVILGADRTEQRRSAHVVMAEARGGQRQRQRLVKWRQAAGAIQPAARRDPISRGDLGQAALERLKRERGVVSRLGQWATAC